ncbi:MAG: metal ABC transporter ATP-binding protein [Caldilineae bacterium]|nr:MAG: metal ABC transporter ATP-binding protein [Caldilineae bacterium]
MVEPLRQLRYPSAPHPPDKPSLALDHVTVQYDGLKALDNVSFEVEAGERVAVVGPNGAGKSTLFQVIAGTLRPSTGTLEIFGHPPGGHICIGYVPQRNQIDWTFPVTVADVVMMARSGKIGLFRWPGRQDWQIVRGALKEVGMENLAGRQIGELSGGQQQRVFIARALAQEAEILLLDEPLTGLDTPSQQNIFEILDRLQARGVTILMATHDLDQAASHFDRMMLLNRRVIAYGRPDQVYTAGNLIATYGGHLHLLPDTTAAQGSTFLLADTCCDGAAEPRHTKHSLEKG